MDPRYLTRSQYVAWRMARWLGRVLLFGTLALLFGYALLSLVGCDIRRRPPAKTECPPFGTCVPQCTASRCQ